MGIDAAHFVRGQGLWIVPSQGVHTFAMRFPIDVLYLDCHKVVIHIQQDLKPWRVGRILMRSKSVLELPGGTLQATGTTVGDEIEIALGEVREAVSA
jgi:uncharacterized membrane protein (UPF0127 family)